MVQHQPSAANVQHPHLLSKTLVNRTAEQPNAQNRHFVDSRSEAGGFERAGGTAFRAACRRSVRSPARRRVPGGGEPNGEPGDIAPQNRPAGDAGYSIAPNNPIVVVIAGLPLAMGGLTATVNGVAKLRAALTLP